MIAVAVDGPAGAGKSTIARRVARELGFVYVDTGALYRAIGLLMLRQGIDPSDPQKVVPALSKAKISLSFRGGKQRVILCGRDVTPQIRTEKVSMAASRVSAIPQVRRFLFSLQREIAEKRNVVMDGRDIGTVVLPHAQVKIFLTASPEERARRRYRELLAKGQEPEYEEVLRDLRARDFNDTHRTVAPLVPARDAVVVDTTGNTLEQSVGKLAGIIRERLSKIHETR